MTKDSSTAFNAGAGSQTVTKDGLKQAEQNRPTPNVELHYTIGGATEAAVHSNQEAERNYAINSGYRTLYAASDNMQHDYASVSKEGVTRAIFQAQAAGKTQSPAPIPEQDNQQRVKPEFKQSAEPQKHTTYAQQQRKAAAQAPAHTLDYTR
ncbi:MAG: hypothetical protein HRU27_11065 [Rhizobiaceae bacterium]|nr:hypothetical protein [Hyphomicrobiales bacterium]NRB31125.1 hypothetical protein [Rhizobiaceae bacterium]